MSRITVALVFVLIAACTLGTILTGRDLAARVTRTQSQVTKLRLQNRSLQIEITGLDSEIGSLTVPTDPLSAYTDICNVQLTNGTTGALQTYYYPCTNSAQTIPQPGN